MKLKFLGKYDRLYARILTALFITVASTIFVLSAILYINFEKIVLYNIYASELHSLSQASQFVKIMNQSSKALTLQVCLDEDVSKLVTSPSTDILDLRKSMGKLVSFNSPVVAPFVQSIYVYNPRHGKFYTSIVDSFCGIQDIDVFFDKDIMGILKNLSNYSSFTPIPRIIPEIKAKNQASSSCGYSFIFYEGLKDNPDQGGAIIINISESWLRDNIKSFDDRNSIFIIDHKGKVVVSNDTYKFLSDISNSKFANRIFSSKNNQGYFVENINGIKSLVCYANFDLLNWTLIRTIPYEDIMKKIDIMKYNTLLIGSIILFMGLLISLFMSLKLYTPIKNILSRLKTLEQEKRVSLQTLKEQLLRDILTGKTYTLESLKQKFTELKINLNTEGNISLLLLLIDNFSEFCSQYTHKDRTLLKFAIANIASETCSTNFSSEALDIESNFIMMILDCNDVNYSCSCEAINNMVKSVQYNVRQYLKISVSAVVSVEGRGISCLEYLYNNAQHASSYRLYLGHQCIIFADKIAESYSTEYIYPTAKEKALLESLMLGKLDEVKIIFKEIIHDAMTFTYTSLYLTLTHLAVAINTAVDIIEKNNSLVLSYDFNKFINKLNECEIIEDVIKQFFNLFEHIVEKIAEKKNNRHEDLLQKVYSIVREQYMNTDLTLDSIANELDMSPRYFSHLFNTLTSKYIPEYINEVRMEKARELLLNTSESISKIVESTGFSSVQYFYRVFKKTYGTSPNEYRRNFGNRVGGGD